MFAVLSNFEFYSIIGLAYLMLAAGAFFIGRSEGIKDVTIKIRRGPMTNAVDLTRLDTGLYSALIILHGTTPKIRFTMVERHFSHWRQRDFSVNRFFCVRQYETDQELPTQFEVTADLQIRKVDSSVIDNIRSE